MVLAEAALAAEGKAVAMIEFKDMTKVYVMGEEQVAALAGVPVTPMKRSALS